MKIIRCDCCGIEKPDPSMGWVSLRYISEWITDETDPTDKHFHSWLCVAAYATGHLGQREGEEAS